MFSAINYLLGLGGISWWRAQPTCAFSLALWSSLTMLILYHVGLFWLSEPLLPPGMILVAGLLAFLGFTILRYRERLVTDLASRWVDYRGKVSILGERVLIVGAGEYGQLAAWLLQKSNFSPVFAVVRMVDDDSGKQRLNIGGHTVLGMTQDNPTLVKKLDVGLILFAILKIRKIERKRILGLSRQTAARVIIIPNLLQILQNYLIQQ